jgi:hypothetical protein
VDRVRVRARVGARVRLGFGLGSLSFCSKNRYTLRSSVINIGNAKP